MGKKLGFFNACFSLTPPERKGNGSSARRLGGARKFLLSVNKGLAKVMQRGARQCVWSSMPYVRADILEFVPDYAGDGRWSIVRSADGQIIAYAGDQEAALELAVRLSMYGAQQRFDALANRK